MEFNCDGIKNNIEQRYEVLLQLAPFGFLLVDLSGEITEINHKALEILGSPDEEATKLINMLSFKPLEEAGVSQLIRDAISTSKPVSKTLTYTSLWGKTSRMRCTACSIIDSSDTTCFIAFIIEDLTELELMKDKYYKAARTLGSVIDSIPHYVWAKDMSGVYQVASKSYAELFGASYSNIVGKTDYALYSIEDAQKYQSDDNMVATTCGTFETEEIVDTPAMGRRTWRTIKNAICSECGEPMLTVGIAEDISDEVERRESAKQAIRELEAFVKRNAKGQ